MKTIGIIGALETEITLLKSKMEIVSVKNIVNTDFYVGKMGSKNVILVKCGVGKVNAAICTQILIDMYGVDAVINTGVAGAIHSDLKIGDVVISKDLTYHDFDVTSASNDCKLGGIPSCGIHFVDSDENMIDAALKASEEVVKGVKVVVGRIVTGDQFIADKGTKEHIVKHFKPHCVEMEGAAIAHTCYLNQIPFVVIRAMSDSADNSADDSFEKHVDIMAERAGAIVESMLLKL